MLSIDAYFEFCNFSEENCPERIKETDDVNWPKKSIFGRFRIFVNNDKIYFTVDDAHQSHQITFVNAREVIVPDTADFPSILMAIIGIVITGFGFRFVYKNGQRA